MAKFMSLENANKAERLVLFDTNVLISAYKSVYKNAQSHELSVLNLLRQIDGSRRFTSELVLWEFLHPKVSNITLEEIDKRRKWLNVYLIKVRDKHPSGYIKTFETLAHFQKACGDPVDGALAAYSVSSKGQFVIATEDRDDFCWHKDIVVIADFLHGKTC